MPQNKKLLQNLFAQAQISQWGVARFADLLPLMQSRAVSRLPQNPQSVIVFLLGYYAGEREHNLARYAWADDYHLLVPKILAPVLAGLQQEYPQNQFALFSDNGPIREVFAGYLAGLGFVGKNAQLINRRFGSMHFIGEIVTDLCLSTGDPVQKSCGDCRACLDACPTGALGENAFERALCRSHITQKNGALSPQETEQIKKGGLVWGCDLCTVCCPYNKKAALSDHADFLENLNPVLTSENLDDLHSKKAYNFRKKAVVERNLRILSEEEK